MELQGKIAIVTGASKGIGLETVKALLEKGVSVAGWSRTRPDINHPNFQYVETDVAKLESVNQAYEQTIKRFGNNIHILINNAGLGFDGLIDEIGVEEWAKMFDINVHGVFYCSRLVTGRMK